VAGPSDALLERFDEIGAAQAEVDRLCGSR
jgi:hypothetical protein